MYYMKKLNFILCLFLFNLGISSAQNYIDYHKEIVKIEAHVLEEDYAPALSLFDSLFEHYDFIYAIDCFTAAQLANLEKKPQRAFFFLRKGIEQGLRLEIIEENGLLKNLQEEEAWANFKRDYPKLRTKYEANIQPKLCHKVRKLYELDAAITEELKGASLIWEQVVYIKWKKQVRRNMKVLKEIIEEHGFPGEKIIGLDECLNPDFDMAATPPIPPVIGRNALLNSKMAFLMTVHYFSDPYPDFNELLLKEVENGNLPPGHYAAINDFQCKYGKQKYGEYKYYNQWHKEQKAKRKGIKEVDKRRMAIGLGSYKHKEKKRKRWLRARAKKQENELVYIRP